MSEDSSTIEVDFSELVDNLEDELAPKKATNGRDRDPLGSSRRQVTLPSLEDLTDDAKRQVQDSLLEGQPLPRDSNLALPEAKIEAVKADYIATGGNIAEVSRQHEMPPTAVARLAADHNWPVYGDGASQSEKSERTRLERKFNRVEAQLDAMLETLVPETKEPDVRADKRQMSRYVESLSQRNTTFKTLFDTWTRLGAMIHPELFGLDPANSNAVAARLARDGHPDGLGGVDGVNREISDFFGRVAVSIADELRKREIEQSRQVIEAEVVRE
ncbi:MAG: hypothetical protein R3320_14570 [Nitriliruptorales bacterium]|nr:hypothetical protein [Nitriliruptorales bacterium]